MVLPMNQIHLLPFKEALTDVSHMTSGSLSVFLETSSLHHHEKHSRLYESTSKVKERATLHRQITLDAGS